MNAEQMFKELGYTKRRAYDDFIVYVKGNYIRLNVIEFHLRTEIVHSYIESAAGNSIKNLDLDELKAIIQQAKELGWLEEKDENFEEKPKYKLSQFEYDLINTFDRCKECCLLNEIECLKKLREKGYFNCIDPFTKVHDIIDNCEVIQ